MVEVYLALEEAAEYEGIKYNTFIQRIMRNPEEFKTQTESARNGGKDRVLIALSSLSKMARRACKEARQIEDVNGSDVAIEKITGQETPWYMDVDLSWYMEKFPKQYYEAVEFSKKIREFLNYGDADRTAFADDFAKDLGISQRTLYRYSQSYLEAGAWAIKLNKEDGKNYDFFKVISLCRKPKEKFAFPSINDEVKAFAENIWFDKAFAANDGTVEMLYSKLEQVAKAKGWEYPSYQTMARYINYLMEDQRGKNAHFLASKGAREYKNKVMIKRLRDTGALPVMGLVQGDEHTFDCWVQLKHPNGKVSAIKPKLVALIDTRTRVIMGDLVCKQPNSQVLKQSFLKMIYSTPGGVPQWLLIDNGKDYTSKTMTGRERSDRVCFDSEVKGFYRSIGIQDDMRSLPYQPWSKAQIERFFGTVCSMFTKWLFSYTGTLTGSKTAAKIKKDIPRMLERGELLTMEEFSEHWKKWLNEIYHNKAHAGLKRQREKYTAPIDLFMNAEERYFKPSPPRAYATILMMKAEQALVRNIGIRKFGQEYMAQELCDYIGEKVDIKWDAEDVTRLYVYTREGKKICEAVSQELLIIAPKVQQKALEEHMKMQKRQLRGDNEKLEKYTTPFDQRTAQLEETPKDVFGTIDLMVKSQHADKVVALPNDKQFGDGFKDKKTKVKQVVESEFLNKQAQTALSKLRALG